MHSQHCRVRNAPSLGWALIAAAAVAACPPSSEAVDSGPTCDPGRELAGGACVPPCPGGARHLAGACAPRLPDSPCDAGTMPVVGLDDCQPVGWTSCPAGFEGEPSGWGCTAVVPPQPCTGATRAPLGQRQCLPVGDCAAPFPPPSATLFVDPTGPVDSTHFRTLQAATAAAPPGAVIAVEAGDYLGQVELPRPLTLVGRCAERVVLRSASPGRPGLHVLAADAGVSGFSFVGHEPGVMVDSGGGLLLTHSVVEGNARYGVIAIGAGSRFHLDDVVVRGTSSAADGRSGNGVHVQDGSEGFLTAVEVSGNASCGVCAVDLQPSSSPSHVSVEESVVQDTHFSVAGGNGLGLAAIGGARADLRRTLIRTSALAGVLASGAGSAVIAEETEIADSAPLAAGARSQDVGAEVQGGASFTLRRSSLVRNAGGGFVALGEGSTATLEEVTVSDSVSTPLGRGSGVTIASGARGSLHSVAIVRSTELGLFVGVSGSEATASRVLVLDTRATSAGLSRAASVEDGTLAADELSVQGALELGVFVGGADAGMQLRHVLVDGIAGTGVVDRGFGHGVLGRFDATVEVADGVLRGCAGVGLIVDGASALVRSSLLEGNAVALHAQNGSTLAEVETAPVAPASRALVVTKDTVFVDNQARTGVGVIPVPGAAHP